MGSRSFFAGGAAALGLALLMTFAEAANTPFGVAPPPEPGGSPLGGPLAPLFLWIAFAQQHFYADMIARMAELRANPWAIWALLGLSFAYGVFHAAGPGHGKAVISGYLVASGERVRRGIVLSFASAFVQAVSAILIVGIAGAILHVTAVTMTAATGWLEVGSALLIVAVGGWLLWSKTLGGHWHTHAHGPTPVPQGGGGHQHQGHGHGDSGHGHDHHAHAHDHRETRKHRREAEHPDHDRDDKEYAEVARVAMERGRSPVGRAWSAILAVGIRPCSGALIVLVFALSQGVFVAGVAATFVMALGTGLTVAVLATLAVSARGLAVRLAKAGTPSAERMIHWAEVAVAAAVFVFGLLLLGGSLINAAPGLS